VNLTLFAFRPPVKWEFTGMEDVMWDIACYLACVRVLCKMACLDETSRDSKRASGDIIGCSSLT